jgi:hypothetical protein
MLSQIERSHIRTRRLRILLTTSGIFAAALLSWPATAGAQTISQRGFIEGRGFVFPMSAPNDTTQEIGDLLIREEVFLKPRPWIQLAVGLDLRANSHDQVESEWRLDVSDRGVRRPRAAIRRLTATFTAPHFTLDVGKQIIRWARADVLNPTDRFAPRDFLNVIDTEVLPVLGVRPSIQIGHETFEVVWVPRLTPSRLPLFDQRWTVLPPEAEGVPLVDGGSAIPKGSEQGVRWNHAGERLEASLSFFDGFNHLPNVESRLLPAAIGLVRAYPSLRSYGADMAVPTKWLTLKGEAAYFTSPTATSDEYVLYVVELERQVREWVIVVGYGGEAVTKTVTMPSGTFPFAPDRGIARSILGRASYTVDPRRTVAIEGAVRQNGDGVYIKGEYSQSFGQHWRLTLAAVGIGGDPDDFLGQYNRNSNGSASVRFSF